MDPIAKDTPAQAVLALDDPVASLAGIGPKRAALLAKLGVASIRDLLFYFPRGHQDRRNITPIAAVAGGGLATVSGRVVASRNVRLRGRMNMAVVEIEDESGRIKATFFGRGFLAKTVFCEGARLIVTGMAGQGKDLVLKNPEYEVLGGQEDDVLNTGRVVPVYRLAEQVSQRMLRKWAHDALRAGGGLLVESLPPALAAKHGFPPVGAAIQAVHFPETLEAGERARRRFAYEELLVMQLALLRGRAARLGQGRGYTHTVNGPLLKGLGRALPFSLTAAQERVISEILADMASTHPMLRLLQGDVGCGKTVVALHAIAVAADGGRQSALMVPTELLAGQHARNLREALAPLGLEVEVLTGSTGDGAAARARIASGAARVVVGTHALFQEKTLFDRLGLIIIDEQHRFGVAQRYQLAAKGRNPDVLHMTATPIPRSMAITLYGAMDLSVIDALPAGRRPIKTSRVTPGKVDDLYAYIRKQAAAGLQTYIVCPLVEESESRAGLTSVIEHYEALSEGPFANLRTALLHGRLDASEKEAVMLRFSQGAIDVLVSTNVIEVGVDVAAATTMVIEDAGQFGLTQLHQLRGRVGRGEAQSYCFLLGKPATPEGKARLEMLCKYDSGFDIAEQDLRLRGPGEFFGLRQAGLTDLRVADLLRDVLLLERARQDATAILSEDPELALPEHEMLAQQCRGHALAAP